MQERVFFLGRLNRKVESQGSPNNVPEESSLIPTLSRTDVEAAVFGGEDRSSIAAFKLWGCGER